jgi:hypothetical protein
MAGAANPVPPAQGFSGLMQSLLRPEETSEPDLKKADPNPASATDPANPLTVSAPIPQLSPATLPFRFGSPSATLVSATSNHDVKSKKDATDSATTSQDDGLGTFIYPSSIPAAPLPVPPVLEPAYLRTPASVQSHSLPSGQTLLMDAASRTENSLQPVKQGEWQPKEPPVTSSAAPVMHDDASPAPRVAAEVIPAFSSSPSTVSFQAKLTPAKSNAAAAPFVSTSASPSVSPIAPETSGQKPSEQGQQDRPSSNPALAAKAQPKALVDRGTDHPQDIEPASAPRVQNDSSSPLSTASPFSERPAETSHRTPEPSSLAKPTTASPEPTHAPAPLRDLSLRLTSPTNEQVDVKVQDKGGQLSVAVHSNSPELSADLRQQVGDLVGKLDRAGIHTEIEKPGSSSLSTHSSAQGGEGWGQESPGQDRQQREDRREQDQQQANQPGAARTVRNQQPEWLQAISGNPATNGAEGAFNR